MSAGLGAIEAADNRATEAEALAAAAAMRADQATRQAQEARAHAQGAELRAQRAEGEARQALDSQASLQQSLDAARERASAAEISSATARTARMRLQREVEATRAQMRLLKDRADSDAFVPLALYETARSRLESLEEELEAVKPRPPVFDVTFRASREMVLDEEVPVSLEVSVPTGEPKPDDAVFTDQIKAVGQRLRASLSGSNFEITSENDVIQSMAVGKAVWDFKVTPLKLGEQVLYASVTQYTQDDIGDAPITLRTDSWSVNVSVDPTPRILAAIYRNAGEFAIGIIMFLGGIIAELTRRRLFGTSEKNK